MSLGWRGDVVHNIQKLYDIELSRIRSSGVGVRHFKKYAPKGTYYYHLPKPEIHIEGSPSKATVSQLNILIHEHGHAKDIRYREWGDFCRGIIATEPDWIDITSGEYFAFRYQVSRALEIGNKRLTNKIVKYLNGLAKIRIRGLKRDSPYRKYRQAAKRIIRTKLWRQLNERVL